MAAHHTRSPYVRRSGRAAFLICLTLTACSIVIVHRTPRLVVFPSRALLDEPVTILVSGLTPGAPITIRARATDDLQRTWESHATFIADRRGEIDVRAAKPVSGTYDEVDGAGLFSSMAVLDRAEEGPFRVSLEPHIVTLTVERDGEFIVSGAVVRSVVR